jgi:hypothetical protein
MTSLPPKIDQRTYEEIVRQTETLAEDFTNSLEQGWKIPAPDQPNQMDVGRALIRIFGRLVTKVSDRLNQVPEKNFLAFLDLIGGQLQPPQPAKVPLTFYLAEASPVGSLVPAYTQISAPPLEGNDEEIIFETEQELMVTTAQLKAVFVTEPSQNKYGDYTLSAIDKTDQSFPIFSGDRPIQHSLYLTCREIFNLPELSNLSLTIETNNPQSFTNLSLNWSYWNGLEWQNLSRPSLTIKDSQCILNFVDIKVPSTSEINGKSGKWLQAKLNSLPDLSLIINEIKGSTQINQANLLSEVCLYNDTPLDQSKDFSPFGEEPQLNDTFYIALHDAFVKPNANITLTFELSRIPNLQSSDITITWEMEEQGEWKTIATKESANQLWMNSAPQLIKNSPMTTTLKFPQQIPSPSTVNGETRYWVRARITNGIYGQAPTIRKYAVYNEVAIVDSVTNDKTISIVGTASDFFKAGDIIRLVWLDNNNEKREEYKITNLDNSKLTLETSVNIDLIDPKKAKGTKIFLRYVMSETVPPNYDPPIIKSLKLTYKFDFNEKSIYFAYNNFSYSQPQKFNIKLTDKIDRGSQVINLNQVEGLAVGEFLTFPSQTNSETNSEIHQIEYINPQTNQLILVESLSQTYSKDTPIYCYFRPFIPTIDKNPSLYLGFDKPFGNQTVTLYVQVNPPSPEELSQAISRSNPQLIWEYFSPLGWQILGVNDQTKAFSQRGLIQFIAPSDFTPSTIFNQALYWLRVRWQGGNFSIQPHLKQILTNTNWAVQATTIQEEILGSSNYEAHQTFTARYSPILIGEKLEIRENKIPEKLDSDKLTVIRDELGEIEEIWVTWQEVPDFYSSTESDRHYLLDRQTGKIRFGDGQAGMIPPRGSNNIRLSFYRVGGGEQGNLVSQSVNQLKTTVPYIDRVVNLEAAAGGADQEKLDRLKERVPQKLRHRNRAVTLQDIEDLAYEASTDVARVKLITPDLMIQQFSALNGDFWLEPTKPEIKFDDYLQSKRTQITKPDEFKNMIQSINNNSGKVKLIVLPNSKERQPNPSLALLEKVESYIRSRCEAMLDLTVTVPQWQEIIVTATITPTTYQGLDRLRETINQRLESFLHPLTGGSGDGWRFGRYPQKSDFYALIQSISGVDHVDLLQINPDPESPELAADSLIFSGHHIINLKSSGGN